jgi:SAM-dependent methyltransferase
MERGVDPAIRPFGEGSFDIVVSTLSMHRWAEPTKGLAEIGRVVRPGGRALVGDFRPGGLARAVEARADP